MFAWWAVALAFMRVSKRRDVAQPCPYGTQSLAYACVCAHLSVVTVSNPVRMEFTGSRMHVYACVPWQVNGYQKCVLSFPLPKQWENKGFWRRDPRCQVDLNPMLDENSAPLHSLQKT